jgi:cyclic pyranopterin phosphate synthase
MSAADRADAPGFSHLTAAGHPRMVDVSAKAATTRTATARALVSLPPAVQARLAGSGETGSARDIVTAKGPVFHTARIAGVMAAKRTAELIPLCHPIGLEDCTIDIDQTPAGELSIECRTVVTQKTGVEMEALTGATVAALTVYDMCKAISRGIVIRDVRLLTKSGGKSGDYRSGDFHADGA